MALKLDISKAYDRVEWLFLEKILLKMGFQESWVRMIMECITTILYFILINGEPQGLIRPSRGLCQGDSLSPFLFLFCAEGRHALLSKAANDGEIRGYSLCRAGPKVTHLFFFFADDCLLFCRANSLECGKILQLLSWYEAVSGQKVNTEKTIAFFSRNTSEETKEALRVMLGVLVIKDYKKYLGLPSFVGR